MAKVERMAVETTREGQATALQALGAALNRRGFEVVFNPGENLPSLSARNPRHARLDETVRVSDNSFWWSWAERIGPLTDIEEAAAAISRVLSAGSSST
jgi:hypothetical protein